MIVRKFKKIKSTRSSIFTEMVKIVMIWVRLRNLRSSFLGIALTLLKKDAAILSGGRRRSKNRNNSRHLL